MIRRAVLVLLLALPAHAAERILFIGNSLTQQNDLPSMVCALAALANEELKCGSVVIGGAALEDHLADRRAVHAIATGRWTIVALQQGPSALPESRELLIRDTRRFAAMIRKAGARPALYAVWPAENRSFDFDRVAESYRLAAADVDGLLFPAGSAWQAAWRRDPRLPLYSSDDFHPSPAGTYLAALVIHRRLFGTLPAALAQAAPRELSEAQVGVLFAAAEEVGG